MKLRSLLLAGFTTLALSGAALAANTAVVVQSGGYNSSSVAQSGSRNSVQSYQFGGTNLSSIRQSGRVNDAGVLVVS